MSDVILLAIALMVVAGVAFLPLGYFIYLYISKKDQPFASTTQSQSKVETNISNLLDTLIHKTQSILGKQ